MHKKAERLKRMAETGRPAPTDPILGGRLPPGQTLTDRFPILYEGEVPQYLPESWNLKVFGEVFEERIFRLPDLEDFPKTEIICDIHCVTKWSKFDTVWEGVRFKDFLTAIDIKPDAKYVMFYADHGYTTNVPLQDLVNDDVLLATGYAGKPLTDKHGWPLRLVLPHMYFWKSAKWIRGIEFMKENRPGFWERNGFSNTADPFKEDRFSGEELEMTEGYWTRMEFD